jgi:hypothetical protein
MTYYAKVDWWLAALIGGVCLGELTAGTVVLVRGLTTDTPDSRTMLGVGAILVGVGALCGLILPALYTTRYEISATELVVRFGPFRWRLSLDAIVEVFPTHNPLSAPAPSLDRLRINYRKKDGWPWFTLVSPKDKEGFVRDLARAAPQLRNVEDEPLRLTVGTQT